MAFEQGPGEITSPVAFSLPPGPTPNTFFVSHPGLCSLFSSRSSPTGATGESTLQGILFFFLINFIIFKFLAVLGLRFCARAFSSCSKWGPLFIAVRGPLTITASLVAEHRLQTRRLSNCGSWAQLLCGMWDLRRPGLEPVSLALAGRFSTTAPPGKPSGNS